MTPSGIKEKVIAERVEWIKEMIAGIKELPLDAFENFSSEKKNTAAAESFLRRALEALLDMGRHILSKGFGNAAVEYKDIVIKLKEYKVIDAQTSKKMTELAGYRNRMVHFYHKIKDKELYDICANERDDITHLMDKLLEWINNNPDKTDKSI